MLESCEDAAAEASLDDLREIASVIALWPPACLPWVLPRLGHRLLFACRWHATSSACNFFDSDLRSLVSAELLEAAIRRDEQRFRDASDARLSGSSTKYKGDPERAFAGYPLLDVFGDWGGLLGNVEPPPVRPEQLLFGHERAACVPDLGTPAFEPSLDEFSANLETFSSGLLRGLTWDGSIIAAGGAVLALSAGGCTAYGVALAFVVFLWLAELALPHHAVKARILSPRGTPRPSSQLRKVLADAEVPEIEEQLAELGAKAPGDVQYLDDADIADLQLSPEQGSRLKSVAARAAAQP